MREEQGRSVCGGIAWGPIFCRGEEGGPSVRRAADTAEELARFEAARQETAAALEETCVKAEEVLGPDEAAIFRGHRLILNDPFFLSEVTRRISEKGLPAARAVVEAGKQFAELLRKTGDEYMSARADDVRDVTRRLRASLEGDAGADHIARPCILAVRNLTPSEALLLDPTEVLGLLLERGSVNSHTAIIIRSKGIPAVTGLPWSRSLNGMTAIVDGNDGRLILAPDERTFADFQARKKEEENSGADFSALAAAEDVTGDGRPVGLYANCGNFTEMEEALKRGARGIGLLRTEYLFLGRRDWPTEEDQFAIYRKAGELMQGKRVVIRTLDIGSDKVADYFQLDEEENPALGIRGIRYCLLHPEVLLIQIRAILRAAVYGDLYIMYPMITTLSELEGAEQIYGRAKKQLSEEGIPFRDVPRGITVETPAAVIMSREFADRCSFLSIGTNDLTQYMMAADRDMDIYQGAAPDPSVLRAIGYVVKSGHEGGIPVTVCGELAADAGLTRWFVETGADGLSVAPASILPVRAAIRGIGRDAAEKCE